MQNSERGLQRTERLSEIRQVFVQAAEAALHEAESRVKHWEQTALENTRQIQVVREEIAYANHCAADAIQNREKYISSLLAKGEEIRQALENAKRMADTRRAQWREAKRDQKVIGKVQERRLHDWQRHIDVEQQKAADEMSIGRYVRNQSQSGSESSSRSSEPVASSDDGLSAQHIKP